MTASHPQPSGDDERSVMAWLSQWEVLIRRRDFDAARRLFDDSVLGFGSAATVVRSLDDLERSQWRRIWPNLGAFAFDRDGILVTVSADRRLAVVAGTWMSTWAGPGEAWSRPGRATVVLARSGDAERWRGVHTHFSLDPALGSDE